MTRDDVMEQLKASLAVITTANGYSCDAGLLVEDLTPLSEEPVQDCIAVSDEDEEYEFEHRYRGQTVQRTLSVDFVMSFVGSNPRKRARKGGEDMMKWQLVFNNDESIEARAQLTKTGTYEDDTGTHAAVAGTIQITY